MATIVVPNQTSPVEDAEALRQAFKGASHIYYTFFFNLSGFYFMILDIALVKLILKM